MKKIIRRKLDLEKIRKFESLELVLEFARE